MSSGGDYRLMRKYVKTHQHQHQHPINVNCDNTKEPNHDFCIKHNCHCCDECNNDNCSNLPNVSGGYLSISYQRVSRTNLLEDPFFVIIIDKGLAYYNGDKINMISIEKNLSNNYQSFNAEVHSYNCISGEIVLKNIKNITTSFDNGLYKYKISLGFINDPNDFIGPQGPAGPQGPVGAQGPAGAGSCWTSWCNWSHGSCRPCW